MQHSLLLSLFLVFLFLPTANVATAAVFERDWNVEGDGLLTYDDVNQREWLDVPETVLANYPAGLDGVLEELQTGERLAGFTWATRADVSALAESAGIEPNVAKISHYRETIRLINLLDSAPRKRPWLYATWGLLGDPILAEPPPRAIASLSVSLRNDGAGEVTFYPWPQLSSDDPLSETGVMLYRQIPEPSITMILFFSIATLMATNLRYVQNR